ncbi:hypothetical protein JD969_05865 [Planctomycetota bacterium]|nr:hypothetical protein JD969_05865 [Planctomycetota bacterium]
MNTSHNYRTATLLSAFTALTLTTSSFAGFDQMPNGHQVFFYNENGAMTLDLPASTSPYIIDIPAYSNDTPYSINLAEIAPSNLHWINTVTPTTINLDGKVSFIVNGDTLNSLFDNSKSSFTNRFSLIKSHTDGALNVNVAPNSILHLTSYGVNAALFDKAGGDLHFSNLAGTLSLSTYKHGGKNPLARAIYNQDQNIIIDNFAGHISVSGHNGEDSISATGMYAKETIQINHFTDAGKITIQAEGVVNGLRARNLNIKNYDGEIDLYTNNSSISFGGGMYADNINIDTFSQTGIIKLKNIKDDFAAINGIMGLSINDSFAGKILIDTKEDAREVSGIQSFHGLIKINDFADTGLININATNGEITGLKAINQKVQIDSFAGNIHLYTQENGNIHGIHSQNDDVEISTFSGGISLDGSGSMCGIKSAHAIHIDHFTETAQINITNGGDTYEHAYGLYAAETNRNGNGIFFNNTFAGDISVQNGYAAIAAIGGVVKFNNISEQSTISVTGNQGSRGPCGIVAGIDTNGIANSDSDIIVEGILAGDIDVTNPEGPKATAIAATRDIKIKTIGHQSTISVEATNSYPFPNVFGLYAYNKIDIEHMAGTVTSTISGHEDKHGNGRVYGIFGTNGIDIDNLSGTVTANAQSLQDKVYAIHSLSNLNLKNITGTIKVNVSDKVLSSAAITTEYLYIPEIWRSYISDDFVHLNSGANIIGDIRLGFHRTDDQDNMIEQGDVLKLTGNGGFNHDLFGIDTINVESYNGESGLWTLNLVSAPDADDYQRNTVEQLNINDGYFASKNLLANYLNISEDGGFYIHIDDEFTPFAVTENITLAGNLLVDADTDDFVDADQTYTLLTAESITGTFDNLDVALNAAQTLIIEYTPTSVIGFSAYNGDTDLSGHIDDKDYANIAASYFSTDNNFTWAEGDFNYDGLVNDQDLELMTAYTGYSLSELQNMISTIPEPTTFTLFSLAAVPLLRRRKYSA